MKTTATGILAALIVILGEVQDYTDQSATTAFQLDVVIAQLVVAWGFFQAANKKPGE
jgi:hypothetical protein